LVAFVVSKRCIGLILVESKAMQLSAVVNLCQILSVLFTVGDAFIIRAWCLLVFF
jgi:hypothetical protein